jgi:hypothetical protein
MSCFEFLANNAVHWIAVSRPLHWAALRGIDKHVSNFPLHCPRKRWIKSELDQARRLMNAAGVDSQAWRGRRDTGKILQARFDHLSGLSSNWA